jgi:hypothetical protein
MASQLQLRRGTTAQHAPFIGAPAEVTVDTDKKTVVVHDGLTSGGFPSIREGTAAGGVLGGTYPNPSLNKLVTPGQVGGGAITDGTIGGSTAISTSGSLTTTGTVSARNYFSDTYSATATDPAYLRLRRGRGTASFPAVVQNNDLLANIVADGRDAALNWVVAGRMTIEVDGSPGTADMPGRIVFSTTADGASTVTERMRITSAGRVGIGAANPSELFQVGDGTGFAMPLVLGDSSSYGAGLRIHNDNTGASTACFIDFGLGADVSAAAIHARKQSDGSTDLALLPSNTVGAVFDAIVMDGSSGGISLTGDVTIADKIIHSGDTDTVIRFPSADTVTVETAGSERLRVSSTGDVSFNSTAVSTSTTVGGASWTSTGYHVLYSNATLAASGILDYYSDWGATKRNVFRVQADGNALNYNNSYGALSDASLKENIVDATPKLNALKQVRVVNFNRIGDPDNKQIGMVAQELELIWPKLVSQDQDGIKSIKYSVLVPILIQAVQELAAKVEALEAAQ